MTKFQKFFSLGFSAEAQTPNLPLMLGGGHKTRTREIVWEVIAWLVVACGIFLRKALALPDMGWNLSHLSLGSFLASITIALATFPSFMRWVNKRRPKPGLEHVATPFAFGFFLDLAAMSALKIVPKLF